MTGTIPRIEPLASVIDNSTFSSIYHYYCRYIDIQMHACTYYSLVLKAVILSPLLWL